MNRWNLFTKRREIDLWMLRVVDEILQVGTTEQCVVQVKRSQNVVLPKPSKLEGFFLWTAA